MRCLACNCALSDYESTRKFPSGGYIDLCNRCFNSSSIVGIAREDLPEVVEDQPCDDLQMELNFNE